MEKLNGFWLCKQNTCEIIVRIQEYFMNYCRGCVLCAIDNNFNRTENCKLSNSTDSDQTKVCEECIRKWITSEHI